MSSPREVCVVFADIAGSTRLYETLGDETALRAIGRGLEAMARATRASRGRVVKTIGDEVMAVFDSAAQGMRAASDMQQMIGELPLLAPNARLAMRAGFHFGPALVENDDVFGDTVNIAARMATLANPGQIVTTGETVAALPDYMRGLCRSIDALAVKGKAGTVNVFEVIWQENAELTMVSPSVTTLAPGGERLHLTHAGNLLELGMARPAVTLGRDPGCDMVIRDPRASRQHARIELRRDKFVLTDISSNGTYVTIDGEAELAIKREELILRGAGRIVFGHPWAPDCPEVLAFSLASGEA
jgi:class 3 adenylate cyclase